MLLRIQQRDASGVLRTPVYLAVEGEPMGRYDDEKKGPIEPLLRKDPVPLPGFDDQEPLEVDQIFNWYNAPIKRLDRLEVGNTFAQSHRTANRTLVVARQFPKTETETPPTSGGSPMGGSGPPQPMGGGPPPPAGGFGPPSPMGGFGAGGNPYGAGANAKVGVQAERYVDLSDQVRRLPIGMVLIVDQAYIPDLLTTMANSRLRMWTTQVHWKHMPGSQVSPPEELGGAKRWRRAAAAPMKGMGLCVPRWEGLVRPSQAALAAPSGRGLPWAAALAGSSPWDREGGMYGGGMFGGGFDPSAALVQDDPNLVELAVYAIGSLYERYPPKSTDPNNPNGSPSPMMP